MISYLIDHISKRYNENYWPEQPLTLAIDMVHALAASDWETLRSCWSSLTDRAQSRIAELLEFGPREWAAPIAMEMLARAEGGALVNAIVYCINANIRYTDFQPEVINRLNDIMVTNQSAVTQWVIRRFLTPPV
jgi:hypothetical protein